MIAGWIVDEYSDVVKPRTEKAIAAENRQRAMWKQPPLSVFESRCSATNWMIQRAADRVEKAEKELRNEKRRLKRCLKLKVAERPAS